MAPTFILSGATISLAGPKVYGIISEINVRTHRHYLDFADDRGYLPASGPARLAGRSGAYRPEVGAGMTVSNTDAPMSRRHCIPSNRIRPAAS